MVKHIAMHPKYGQLVLEWENNLPKSNEEADIMIRMFQTQFYQKELGKLMPEMGKYPPTMQGGKLMIPEHPKNNLKCTSSSDMSDFQRNMIESTKSTRVQVMNCCLDGLLGCNKLSRDSGEDIYLTSDQRKRMIRYSNKLREHFYSEIDKYDNHISSNDNDKDNNNNYNDNDDADFDDRGEDADENEEMEM